MESISERLQQQMGFIAEADKLKHVFRQSYLSDQSRRENDAEHSWHLCLMVLLLAEHSNFKDLDTLKVLKMLIIHDIIEIDAGDTYIYDEEAKKTQAQREAKAADRLFGLLPGDQSQAFHDLWIDFETEASDEARFAKAVDRLHPMILNHLAEGKTWGEHKVTAEQVRAVNRKIEDGSASLWTYTDCLIRDAVAKGWLPSSE